MPKVFDVNTGIEFSIATARFRPAALRLFHSRRKKAVKGVKPGPPPSPPLPPFFGSLQKSRRVHCDVAPDTERRIRNCIEEAYREDFSL
jgi:hypothetical protein